jgi:hypothetical protein
MTSMSIRHRPPPLAHVTRLAARVAAIVTECHYAQRRMVTLATSPDRYLLDAGIAPGTYQEFLFRTSGQLAHEPAAAGRRAGHTVR